MDQLDSNTAGVAALSDNAASMWDHYKTVQVCEPHLRMGQQPIVGQNPYMEEEDTLGRMDDRQEVGGIEKEVDKERSEEGGEPMVEQETKVEDISIAVAALLPLLPSPSPGDSPGSSIPSSCFLTPASTPSRSPSPPPHSPLYQANNTSQQLTAPLGDFIDGYQDNGNRGDEPLEPHPSHHSMFDAETQTLALTAMDSFTQTHSPVAQDSSTNTEREETHDLIDNESQTEGREVWEGGRNEVACNTELQMTPELLERAQLTEQVAHLQSEMAAGTVQHASALASIMI